MPSSEDCLSPRRSLAQRAAAIFFAGGLAAYLLAPAERPREKPALAALAAKATSTATSEAKTDSKQPERFSDEVQRMLAEGGCPGWIALASDPALQQSINERAANTHSGELIQTAAHEAALPPPRVQYPVPLRVAMAADPNAAQMAAPPQVSDAPGDDELIPESEDLLLTSPEITGQRAEAGSATTDATEGDALTPNADIDAVPSDPVDSAADEPAMPVTEDGADDDALLEPSDDLVPPPTTDGPASPPRDPAKPLTPPVPERQGWDALDIYGAAPLSTTPSADELLDDHDDLLVPPPQTQPTAPPASPPQGTLPPPSYPPAATPVAPSVPAFAPPPVIGGEAKMQAGGASSGGAEAGGDAAKQPTDALSRCEFVAKSLYPAASECRSCHEKIYDEWSISSHAYSFVSPMFHKFEQKINDIASGTIGYFCYRCHTPAGTSLGISRAAPIWELPLVAREGVTCVACHRVREMYGKTNGERRIEPGPIFAPIYGTIGGDGVAIAAANKSEFKVHTMPGEKTPGIDMHASGECFPQLGRSEFCTSCHQVAVYPGIKLEVVWEQYRASPACKKGIQCQDCHMGRIPGVPSGYEFGPAALINNKNVHPNRKHSNHTFYGPGYSIAHPGVFPFNPKAERWKVSDWLQFDWRAGWGTDDFEDAVDDGRIHITFPDVWKEADDRYDAREIIEDNLKKRALKDRLRAVVMENGSHVDGPFFEEPARVGQELKFSYLVVNTNDGHNLPTASLGAQPQLWANVVLIGPSGQRLWESGYLDSNGDLADIHSVDVREKRLEFDWQLFNLQTMFLITGAKGTDREFYLPVNIDIDPLPFIRPAPQPVSVLNHPPFIRMEARSLAPLGSRRVPYKVPGTFLCEPGRYRLSFRMRSRTEPLYFMRFCESTLEMQRAMIEGTLDFHEGSVEFDVR